MLKSSRFPIARVILKNCRIAEYEHGLRLALERGYQIGGITDFLRTSGQGQWLVLRHDVDEPVLGVREMLRVESRLGVRSTWYFRWSTFDDDLVREVRSHGGEAGLHYETLATVLERHGVVTRDLITPSMMDEARNELRLEVAEFRRRLGLELVTIASHGHARNQRVRLSNNVLVNDAFCQANGIEIEAYSPHILDRIACYVSDTNLLINEGWAYGTTLDDAIESRQLTICFLTHPNHWRYTWPSALRDLAKLTFRGVRYQQRHFRAAYEP